MKIFTKFNKNKWKYFCVYSATLINCSLFSSADAESSRLAILFPRHLASNCLVFRIYDDSITNQLWKILIFFLIVNNSTNTWTWTIKFQTHIVPRKLTWFFFQRLFVVVFLIIIRTKTEINLVRSKVIWKKKKNPLLPPDTKFL